jgi:hypothetical protein
MEFAAPCDGALPRDTFSGPALGRTSEEALRRVLLRNPNDERSFARLVSLLAHRRTADRATVDDSPRGTTDDLTWALAAELAACPRAWFPLTELARLSLSQDIGTALRRLVTAVDREPTGRGLTRAVALLRNAGHPGEAFRLALAHWRPRDHELAAGRQLVLAGIEAGRAGELRRHLDALASRPGNVHAQLLRAELALRNRSSP